MMLLLSLLLVYAWDTNAYCIDDKQAVSSSVIMMRYTFEWGPCFTSAFFVDSLAWLSFQIGLSRPAKRKEMQQDRNYSQWEKK